MKPETMMIDDVKYIREDAVKTEQSFDADGKECVIVRSYDAGVFCGYLAGSAEFENPDTLKLYNARRLWRWSGAASLSQLCVDGVANKNDCKFPCEVPWVVLNRVCEVLPCSDKAKKTINEVPVWTA